MELASRKDAPVIRKTTRGSMAPAIASGRPENQAATLDAYEHDKFTPGALSARQSLWNSWQRLHENWFGMLVAVRPLTSSGTAALRMNAGLPHLQPHPAVFHSFCGTSV